MTDTAALKLHAALLAITERYASISESGAIEVAITPVLYSQIDDALASAPCGYHLTDKGRAALQAIVVAGRG